MHREEENMDMDYEKPEVVVAGDFNLDTADNRPFIGWDWHVSGRN